MFLSPEDCISYDEYKKMYLGPHPSTVSALQEHINRALKTLFEQDDYWTLEIICRLLEDAAKPNENSLEKFFIIQDLDLATPERLKTIGIFISNYLSAAKERRYQA